MNVSVYEAAPDTTNATGVTWSQNQGTLDDWSFYNTSAILEGKYWIKLKVEDIAGNYKNVTATIWVKPNIPPTLSNAIVTPLTGNVTTRFNFTVNYTDLDNTAPIFIYININSTVNRTMSQINPADTNYTDGVLYTYVTLLGVGSFDIDYYASDGISEIKVSTSPTILSSRSINSSRATTTTTIDGRFTVATEYDDAIEIYNPENPKYYLYIKNDDTYLYLFIDAVTDTSSFPTDMVRWYFDELNDDTLTTNEEVMVQNQVSNFMDKYYWGGASWIQNGSPFDVGIDCWAGFVSSPNSGSSHAMYECKIPLAYLNVTPGQTIGFGVRLYDYMASPENNYFPIDLSVDNPAYYSNLYLKESTNAPPILADGNVTPSSGNASTIFSFHVNYTDSDNDPPTSILVYINGSNFTMTQRLVDSDYTDGCIYEYNTTLSPGSYSYYFTASDSEYSARLPAATDFIGPMVAPNQVPQLSDPMLSPQTGYNTTLYAFTINYTDLDNDAPLFIELIINGVGNFAMGKQNLSDSNYLDGCIYNYSLYLDVGNYTHYFNASDGYDIVIYPSVGFLIGPNVTMLLNQPPQLLNGSVLPSSGDASTVFMFKITYMDPDNDSPYEIYVVIDGFNYSMNKTNPADTNYTDGIEYVYATTLSVGPHTYYFTTSDGITIDRFPAAGTIDGPTVEESGEGAPGKDLLYIILIAVVLAVAMPIVTYIIRRKRRPAGTRKTKKRPLELKPVKKFPPPAVEPHVKAEPTTAIQPTVVTKKYIKPVASPTQQPVIKAEPIKPVTPLFSPVQPPAAQAPLTEAQLKEILDSIPYLPASEKEKLFEKMKNMSYKQQQAVLRAFKR